ncbi:ACP S-malonyltransferase [Methyloparacoccus murrellii]
MRGVDSGLAFIFPGQGSQSVGMLAELAQSHGSVAETFAEASETLGYELWDLVCNGPEERLNATRQTQPAMLAAGVAAWRVWCRETDVRPAWLAGHSLGEYTALVCAGVLEFRDGIRLVAERARLMQEAVPEHVGAMAAVLGLDDAQVLTVCEQASHDGERVTAANFNAPGQVVIAGHREAVARATELAKAAGAKRAVILPVSVPSHCPLMQPAADAFRGILAAIPLRLPALPVIHNVDVAAHAEPEAMREALTQQLCGSVRWVETIRHMAAQGVDRFVECGPGRVLAGLNKRIVGDARTEALFDTSSLLKAKGLLA